MPRFTFKVLKAHKSCLYRQSYGAIKISTDGVLNSRCEYRQKQVKRLTISLTARELKEEETRAASLDLENEKATADLRKRLSLLSFLEIKIFSRFLVFL